MGVTQKPTQIRGRSPGLGRTKPTEAEPVPAGETDTAPVAPSKGKSGLPVVSAAGAGAWNSSLVGGIVQVAAGTDLRGDDLADALPRVRAAVEAMTGIGPEDVIADMAAAQLVSAHSLAMDCYRRAAGGGEP